MNHELAKTLTTALVQFIDRERPEGTMCCSNTDCANLEVLLTSNSFDDIEAFIRKKLSGLTEFEQKLVSFALQCGGQWDTASVEAKKWSREFITLAKKEIFKNGEGTYFYSKDGIDSLPEEKPSEDLERAARHSEILTYPMPEDGDIEKVMKVQEARIFHEIGFIAGAEWQKKQDAARRK